MKNIININPRKGNNICTISCIQNVITYYGAPIKEYETYFLVNGFQTVFKDGYVALNTLEKIDYELSNRHFDTVWINNDTNQLDIIIDSVIKGQPVIALMESEDLAFDSRLNKEYDFLRSFIIYGVDLEQKEFYIYDTFYLNELLEIEVISFSVSISLIMNKVKEFLIISNNIRDIHLDYKEIFIENMKKYINNNEINQEHFFGINAIKKHICYLENILYTTNNNEKLQACYYATNTIIYGTFIPMITYITEFIKNIELQEKENIINELKRLKSEWNILSNKSMKLTVSKRKNQPVQFIDRYKLIFKDTIIYLEEIIKYIEK